MSDASLYGSDPPEGGGCIEMAEYLERKRRQQRSYGSVEA